MKEIIKVRKAIQAFYEEYSFVITPAAKFLLAFLVYRSINASLGYMAILNNLYIELILSLAGAFVPLSVTVFFAGAMIVMESYAAHAVAAVMMLLLFCVLYTFFLRFAEDTAAALLLTPLACYLGVPAIVPVACGLLSGPSSVIAICCSIVIYSEMQTVMENVMVMRTLGLEDAMTVLLTMTDGVLNNPTMISMLICMAAVVLVVFFLRRLSVSYAWHIAVGAGSVCYGILSVCGKFFLGASVSKMTLITGFILSLLAGEFLTFLLFEADYKGTQFVQFEDDQFYYYVRMIPKAGFRPRKRKQKKTVSQLNIEEKLEETLNDL